MNRFLGVLSLAGIAATVLLWNLWRSERREKERLRENQNSLLSEVEFYKTASGQNAASVERLTLTVNEFRRYFADYTQNIEQMGIRLRRVESLAQSALQADYRLETVVRDSVVYRDRTDTLRVIEYRNPYLDMAGTVDSGVFRGRITTYDTIDQVVHRVPRKFLFLRFGTKAIRQEVVTRNPYSRITYSRYIELGKKK